MANTRKQTYELVIDALFIALTLIAAFIINIRLPLPGSGGLIHLGAVPALTAAMLYGKKTGAIVGGIGLAVFDILGGWTAWAPFTFIIYASAGYVAGLIAEKKPFAAGVNNILTVVFAVIIDVVGYYFAEVILYGNWIAPIGSIPGNLVQMGVSGIVVLVYIQQLRKVLKQQNMGI